ncbi:DUF4326 domain-containing protein, partial [Rhizobium johnstonii]|uniref:DUF4326 domain-containing protein n=1 Tax=Rhizobium johnstonii TaxID=3019933 RepID=UPI003F94AC87
MPVELMAAFMHGRGGIAHDLPHRVQLSRKKGWRKPANTVVVARPSKWGNPFRISDGLSREQAVA